METRCKFSINCENENPKDQPIAYCAFSSNWGGDSYMQRQTGRYAVLSVLERACNQNTIKIKKWFWKLQKNGTGHCESVLVERR